MIKSIMERLEVQNFGQIKQADITFGDLTLFVGSQATGKSILLELIKLLSDSQNISFVLSKNGYFWKKNLQSFFELYFGEGMQNIWNENTQINLNKKNITLKNLHKLTIPISSINRIFFIPAQRVLTLENGWPRAFSSFEIGDPYVLRDFSESLRKFMQNEFRDNCTVFPREDEFDRELQEIIDKSIFNGATVELDTIRMRRRIQLNLNGERLPFMAWSSGQREFMPLLLGLYMLMSVKPTSRHRLIKWVIIEEPEMGLHPQAIISIILIFLQLLDRGYKVIISTHSPVLLEALWAIRFWQAENPDPKYLCQLFAVEPSSSIIDLFQRILTNKKFSTYYFDRKEEGVFVRDISSLDPFSEDSAIADWGGLTSFSSRASEVVSQAAREKSD